MDLASGYDDSEASGGGSPPPKNAAPREAALENDNKIAEGRQADGGIAASVGDGDGNDADPLAEEAPF